MEKVHDLGHTRARNPLSGSDFRIVGILATLNLLVPLEGFMAGMGAVWFGGGLAGGA